MLIPEVKFCSRKRLKCIPTLCLVIVSMYISDSQALVLFSRKLTNTFANWTSFLPLALLWFRRSLGRFQRS